MLQLNFILLLVTIFINCLLGIVVFFSSQRNRENLHFFFIVLSVFLWATPLFFYSLTDDQAVALNLSKISYFAAGFSALSVLNFSLFFVYRNMRSLYEHLLSVFNFLCIAILGAFMYNGLLLNGFSVFGSERIVKFGELYNIYIILLSLFSVISFIILFVGYKKETDNIRKKQIEFIFIGFLMTISGGILTNLILPTFGNFDYYWLGPIFTLVMVGFITTSILKHHLFNIKVIATELLTILLWILLLIRTLLATSRADQLINGGLLLATIILGILLIRGVLNEVKAREEIERLAKDLERVNAELKRLDQAKSEFISIASHQLRTPLSIIKGYISLIREGNFGDVSDTVKKTMNKIYLSNERLIKLVADLLDLSRMESGKLQYEFADFNFNTLVDSIADEFKIPMADKGLAMTLRMPEAPISVWGDSWKLRQVIFNLIDNSLKYTKAGSIDISLQKNNDSVVLAVKDTGVGMSEETMKNLFQKFARGYDANKINVQGLGLGLFIAKKIVDDHKGELSITSEGEGKGSTFMLTLPLKKA